MTNLNTIKKENLHGSQKQLISEVDDIIEAIESGKYEFEAGDYDEPSAADYLKNVLEINYIIGSDKSYKGAILLVAFGGPNIWINTREKKVEGYWGGDEYVKKYFEDTLGIDDEMEEIYNCS